MIVEAKPTVVTLRANIDQQPGIVVVGEVHDNRVWKKWSEVFIAPIRPAYGLKGLQKVYERFLKQGFTPCNRTCREGKTLRFGDIKFDEGNERRLLIAVYPDGQMAREAYEWVEAEHIGGFAVRALQERYKEEGKPEPDIDFAPIGILRRRWLRYQIGRVKSIFHPRNAA